jgi:eukaryotic-like serine/threonine-protein kinase
LIRRSRLLGALLGFLLLGFFLSSCGAAQTAQNWPGLTLDGDILYAISGAPQQVYLVDAENGMQRATFVPQGRHGAVLYWSPVTVAETSSGEKLGFVGFADPQTNQYALYAFDAQTGQEKWSFPAQDLILPAPEYGDGTIYFGSSDGRVYAVDVETQRLKPGWPFEAKEAIWAAPLFADGRLFVAAMDHHLYCLDAHSAEVLWSFQASGAMAAEPALDSTRGILYVGAFDGQVYALSADSGQPLEGFAFEAKHWIWSQILVTPDRLYVTSLDGRLYALDPDTGAVIPPYPYDSSEVGDQSDLLRAAPALAGENVLIATESGRLISVKEGRRQWYWPSGVPEAAALTAPVVEGNLVYVILMNGRISSLQADTGVQGWSFSPQ